MWVESLQRDNDILPSSVNQISRSISWISLKNCLCAELKVVRHHVDLEGSACSVQHIVWVQLQLLICRRSGDRYKCVIGFLFHWLLRCVFLSIISLDKFLYSVVLQASYTLEASELLSTITSLPRSMEARSSCDWRTQIRAGWFQELQSPLRTCWSGPVRNACL